MTKTQRRNPQKRTTVYPWELSEETRAIGRAGLARVRSILEESRQREAQSQADSEGQLVLELDFTPPPATTVSEMPVRRLPARRSTMAA